MSKPNVLFLTRFSALTAYTRYRVTQYLPFVEQAGFGYTLHPLFPDIYLKQTYTAKSRSRALVTLVPLIGISLARRWGILVRKARKYDAVFVQYEALPYSPFFFEKALFQSDVPVVVDYDDAISLMYEHHPNRLLQRMLRAKIPKIVARSAHILTANRNLAEWATQFNEHVTIIPNSVDLRKSKQTVRRSRYNVRPVIGWIGTPVTAKYLRLLEQSLQALRSRHDFVLKVIGAPEFTMSGIDVHAVRWSEATEADELCTCDIGVMPLPDDAWARGKSALKLIQYMAAGIAAVASPVGANCDVLEDGHNGFLAATDEEWTEKLAVLIEEPLRREQLAMAGRRTVEEFFSLETNAPVFVDVLRRLIR